MSPYWLIAVLVAIFGLAIYGRSYASRPPREESRRPEPEPLRPGESYDTSVKLAMLPNAPLAELWCQRLQQHGIEAFSKSGTSSGLAGMEGGMLANPWGPVEVWVGEHDLERARELFPELA